MFLGNREVSKGFCYHSCCSTHHSLTFGEHYQALKTINLILKLYSIKYLIQFLKFEMGRSV